MALTNRVCFQVNLRDCLRCRVCGREPVARETYHRGFEYHHVVAQSAGGADETSNLVLLCRECHLKHHQNKLALPDFGDLSLSNFRCHDCDVELNPETVEMNCGWYRCENCKIQTHLWTHCGYEK